MPAPEKRDYRQLGISGKASFRKPDFSRLEISEADVGCKRLFRDN